MTDHIGGIARPGVTIRLSECRPLLPPVVALCNARPQCPFCLSRDTALLGGGVRHCRNCGEQVRERQEVAA